VNVLEMLLIWACAFALEFVFIFLRLMCGPLHYFGDHFADLEKSYRY
jgi:hypothetical protein